jgi:iron complex outermembrane receptor protein
MTHSLRSALVAALIFLAATSASAQVRGTVLDAQSKVPLGDVAVASTAGSTVTDRDGRFTLPCSGPATVAFRKAGYRTAYRAIERCDAPVEVGLVAGAPTLSTVEVVDVAERAPGERAKSITLLGKPELQRSTGLFLQDAINLTPGIYMQRRSMSGGQTIRIRGYSNGGDAGNFTGTGYKAYLNGIPITDAEGQTVLDDIDFANLGRVDVIRGPSSSLYGAGIGGVVNFHSERPSEPGVAVRQGLLAGEDGLLRSDTRLSRVTDGASVALNYGHQGYDSYRVHSASKKDFASFLGDFQPSVTQSLTTFLSYANSRDQRAGELDSVSFAQELNAGEAKYIANNARSDIESFRTGVTQRYAYNDRVESVLTGYYGGNTLEDVYAAGINSKSNQTFGARAVLNTNIGSAALPLRGTTGLDVEKTNVDAQGYGLTNAVLGPLRSDLEMQNMQYSAFSQWDASLPAAFTLTLGASANFLEYAIIDRMTNTGNPTHKDASGRKTFDPVITPMAALRKQFTPSVSAYASVSQGYTPPTSSDAVIPYTGEPNSGLEAERATQYEVGSAGSLLGNRLSYQVALFDTRVKNKLTSQGVFDTDGTVLYSYTVNAGDQADRGLELSAGYTLVDDAAAYVSRVRPFMSYTSSDFEYRNFRSNANDDASTVDYSGNKVVGVASDVVNFGVDARLRPGVYGNATYHRTAGMPISYDNAHWAPGFSLINAKVGVAHEFSDRFTLDAYVGGNNLGNSRYYTQVFLNHKFDSPTPPNMYLPGPYTAKYYTGLQVTVRP